ncbi:MAG: MaoC family dehydratase [Betaproteobacteria bacterium]|nr:MaoC family dehydratase [Betaproteobacteria bacterium]
MPKVTLNGIEALRAVVGQEVVVSDWLEVTQTRINQFAEATGDFQWIHVDVERSLRESPFKAPIAHGFLTLSLLSKFVSESLEFAGTKVGVNYGFNRLRFTDPVPVGSRIRARFTLAKLEDLPGGVQMTWAASVEREGSDKPCLVAEWLTRRYF